MLKKNVTSVIFRRTDKFEMPIGLMNRPSKTKLKATIKLRLNYTNY